MRAPSVKTLSLLRKFDGSELTHNEKTLIRDAIRDCGNQWNGPITNSRAISALTCLNSLLQGFGVEAILGASGFPVACYVNLGDAYTTTLLYVVATQSFRVQSYGDFVERYQVAIP